MEGKSFWRLLTIYIFVTSAKADKDDEIEVAKSYQLNEGPGWGKQITSYFLPPQTGEYKFYSSCSHNCHVYLSESNNENDDPNLIISQRESVQPNIFDKFPDQASHTIYMQKNHRYFLKAFSPFSNKNVDSHLSVGVILPDDTKLFPISKPYLRNIVVEKVMGDKDDVKKKPKKPEEKAIKGKHKKKVTSNKRVLKKLERIAEFMKSIGESKDEEKLIEDEKIGDMMNKLKEYTATDKDDKTKKSFKITTHAKDINPFRAASEKRIRTRDKMFTYTKKPKGPEKKETFSLSDLAFEKSRDVSPSTPSRTSEELKSGWNSLIKNLENNVDQERSGLLFNDDIKADHYKSKLEKIKEEINSLKREIKGDHVIDKPQIIKSFSTVKTSFKPVQRFSSDSNSGSGDVLPTENATNLTFDYVGSGFEGDVSFDVDESVGEKVDNIKKNNNKKLDAKKTKQKSESNVLEPNLDGKNKFKSNVSGGEVSNKRKQKKDKELEKLHSKKVKEAKEKLDEMLMTYKQDDDTSNVGYVSFDDSASGDQPNEIIKYPKKTSKKKKAKETRKQKSQKLPKLLINDPAVSNFQKDVNKVNYFSTTSFSENVTPSTDQVSSESLTTHGKRDSDSQNENVVNIKVMKSGKSLSTDQPNLEFLQTQFMKTADAFNSRRKQESSPSSLLASSEISHTPAVINNNFSEEKDMTNELLGKPEFEHETTYVNKKPMLSDNGKEVSEIILSKLIQPKGEEIVQLNNVENMQSKTANELLTSSHPSEVTAKKVSEFQDIRKPDFTKEITESEPIQITSMLSGLHEPLPKQPITHEPFQTDQAFVRDPNMESTEEQIRRPINRQQGLVSQYDSTIDARIPEGRDVKALEETLYKAFEAKYTPNVEDKLFEMKNDVPKMVHKPKIENSNERLAVNDPSNDVVISDPFIKKVDNSKIVDPIEIKTETSKQNEPQVSSFIKVDTNNLQKVLEDAFTGKFHYTLKDDNEKENAKIKDGESLKEQLQATIENAISRSKFQDRPAPEIENAIRLANAAKKSIEMSSSSNFETEKNIEKPVTIYRNDNVNDITSIGNHSVSLQASHSLINPLHGGETSTGNEYLIRDYSKSESDDKDENHRLKEILLNNHPSNHLNVLNQFEKPTLLSEPTNVNLINSVQPKIMQTDPEERKPTSETKPLQYSGKEGSEVFERPVNIGVDFETGSRHENVPDVESAEEQENYSRKIRELLNQIDIIKQEIISMKRNKVEGKSEKKDLIEQLKFKKRQLNKLRAKKNNVNRPSKKHLIPSNKNIIHK